MHVYHTVPNNTINRMEPLIKLNNKNNLFDCPIHKTNAAAELLDGNQHNCQQHYYLKQQKKQIAENATGRRDKNIGQLSDAEFRQQTGRTHLLILW